MTSGLLLVHRIRIEQPVRIGKDETGAAVFGLDLAVEAGPAAGVTRRADLLDTEPDRILIAIGADLDHALGLTRGLTFSPQGLARAAEVPGLAGRDGLAQRLVVHVRDHQHVAGGDVGRDDGHEPGRVELGKEGETFLGFMGVSGHNALAGLSRGQRCRPRTRDRKRACSAGLSRNMPVKRLVKVEAPCLATPRTDMQVCSASISTATPRGLRTSSMAAATCAATLSWVWTLLRK